MKKKVVILGSTGSIGRSALEVIDQHGDRLEVLGLSAHSNRELFLKQIEKYKPEFVTLTDKSAFDELHKQAASIKTQLLPFDSGITFLAGHPDADIVLNGIVGAAGLQASVAALRASKRLALANKESMVIGGDLINDLIDTSGGELIPVDSEHSAIFQAMLAGKPNEVRKIILTASGGPFRDWPREKFAAITKTDALNHPTWKMGPKITVDSATMMNKGLEVIEAVQLFGVPPAQIEVVIHPQSIIHSMVEFTDSSIIAQLSNPDMRLPIAYSFFYPERCKSAFGQADFGSINKLTFEKPDFEKFPLMGAAYRAAEEGGTVPAVLNAANEIAVAAFLNEKIGFQRIPEIVIKVMDRHNRVENPTYDDIMEADTWGRKTTEGLI